MLTLDEFRLARDRYAWESCHARLPALEEKRDAIQAEIDVITKRLKNTYNKSERKHLEEERLEIQRKWAAVDNVLFTTRAHIELLKQWHGIQDAETA